MNNTARDSFSIQNLPKPQFTAGPSIGTYAISNRVFVAPMAGVTDRPFRQLCKRLGAGYAVSEMAASNPKLWATIKTARRTNHDGESDPKAVQLAGADPQMMAEAAKFNVDRGAQIIDINMGCPAKKVCNVFAGSALMGQERLALEIIEAVVQAVNVPVTVKMRTGINTSEKNVVQFAKNAESAGAQMVTVHGRSRACAYVGAVDYDSIAAVKAALSIPVVANGDIDSPQKAQWVLEKTGADAVMIGRAAQGNPWIFGQINHFLETGKIAAEPALNELEHELKQHLAEHYAFYGEFIGVRTARKHVGWYLKSYLAEISEGEQLRTQFNLIESIEHQSDFLATIFSALRSKQMISEKIGQPFRNSEGVVEQCWRRVA
jgi:tRNA-dihydrouridine synthase B